MDENIDAWLEERMVDLQCVHMVFIVALLESIYLWEVDV